MSGISPLMLVIFSAFTMNLTLQCALGIKGAAFSGNCGRKTSFIRLLIIFISVILLWFLFSKMHNSIFSGMLVFIIMFPVSYMIYSGLEYIVFKYLFKENMENESFISFPEGITAVAVFICLNIANGFHEVFLLSFGFTAGILLVIIIISEIKKRSELEAVPRFMRGTPLVLVTMGMLSLIFSAGSLLILGMIFVK
jgi:Na+-translocating ferredoxin:NAD+ oxidoreductase subunit A